MFPHRLFACLGLVTALAMRAPAAETEINHWPFRVAQVDPDGKVTSWQSLGPFVFKKPTPEGGTSAGLRPLYVQTKDARGDVAQALFAYPLFAYAADQESYRWSIFELVKRSGRKASAPPPLNSSPEPHIFEVWPFWFSRQEAGEPDYSYRALFPIAGELKNRFGFKRVSWTLFPFYVRSEKRDTVTTGTPWPFVRVTRGAATGFALWPLFGWLDGPAGARQRFYAWPFVYNNSVPPASDAPAGTPPSRQFGVLPLYTRETSPGFINENYLWPFFGYTDRTEPYRYHETRYFWPFFLQARGDDRYRNRWGPFYTHSIVKGYDKTWIGWPVYRQAEWTDGDLTQLKRQVLFFLYYSVDQRSATNPNLPHANKTHLWPLYSQWDNGAGRRQLQLFSPIEVFFPNNDKMRQVWTPLFAIYRSEQAPGFARRSFLWSAVTHQREPSRSELHVGPLLSIEENADAKRVALARGLVSFRRESGGGGWRTTWLDFRSKKSKAAPSTR